MYAKFLSKVHLQPESVDFIDNRAGDIHPAFEHPYSYYHYKLRRWVNIEIEPAKHQDSLEVKPATAFVGNSLTPELRGVTPDSNNADWFMDAMDRLRAEQTQLKPTGSGDSQHSIRTATCWEDVFKQLDGARNTYTEGRGRIAQIWRETADKISYGQRALRFVPSIDYLTPVVSIFEIIFEAMGTASLRRQESLAGSSDLPKRLDEMINIDRIFPGSSEIRQTGTELIFYSLVAVEELINFYSKSSVRKIAGALVKGGDYSNEVVESLAAVLKSSDDLVRSSHMIFWKETRQSLDKQTKSMEKQTETLNNLTSLLNDHIQEKDDAQKVIKEKDEEIEKVRRQRSGLRETKEALEQELQMHRRQAIPSPSPIPPQGMGMSTHIDMGLNMQHRIPNQIISHAPAVSTEETLWPIFGRYYTEDSDMDYILEHQERVPESQRAATQDIARHGQFCSWMVSPSSGHLLIEGGGGGEDGISVAGWGRGGSGGGGQDLFTALSVFTSLFVRAHRPIGRFISLAYFCGMHRDEGYGPREMLMAFVAQLLLQNPGLDLREVFWVKSQREQREQWREDVLPGKGAFGNPLGYDDPGYDYNYNQNWHHYDNDDDDFCQDEAEFSDWDIAELCDLIDCSMRQLPQNTTVFFVIDGIHVFERDEYNDDLLKITESLLELYEDPNVLTTIKILLTSPWRTCEVKNCIGPDSIMFMNAVEPMAREANHRVLSHQLGRDFRD